MFWPKATAEKTSTNEISNRALNINVLFSDRSKLKIVVNFQCGAPLVVTGVAAVSQLRRVTKQKSSGTYV